MKFQITYPNRSIQVGYFARLTVWLVELLISSVMAYVMWNWAIIRIEPVPALNFIQVAVLAFLIRMMAFKFTFKAK